jgi:hypothetical protein
MLHKKGSLQWSTANCPPKTCLVPHPETSACPKKVSPICGQISLYSKLIFFECPPSESGIDQPSQKKCPPGGGQFAVLHCSHQVSLGDYENGMRSSTKVQTRIYSLHLGGKTSHGKTNGNEISKMRWDVCFLFCQRHDDCCSAVIVRTDELPCTEEFTRV